MIMSKSLQLALCDTQGQLFELAAERGYSSEAFIKAFMTSQVAADMDKEFHHVQWAGKAYILSRMEDELADQLTKDGEIVSLKKDTFALKNMSDYNTKEALIRSLLYMFFLFCSVIPFN